MTKGNITVAPSLTPAQAEGWVESSQYDSFEPESPQQSKKFTLRGILRALTRYWWLVALATVVGGAAGYLAWNVIAPEYVAQGNLWVQQDEDAGVSVAIPILEGQLLTNNAWLELLRSYSVLDPVVVQEKLYLTVPETSRSLFDSFELGQRFSPGTYRLVVSDDGRSWTLSTSKGLQVATGALGDSIGANVGFSWRPPAQALQPNTEVSFTVVTPRDASRRLGEEMGTRMDASGNFISITLRGKDPEKIASILNAVMTRHVGLAADLKRSKLEQRRGILEDQLNYAEKELAKVEGDLEAYRVKTVTLPSDPSNPIAAGLEQTRDPVFNAFFQMKVELEQLSRDRQGLEAALSSAAVSGWSLEALETIGSVKNSPELVRVMAELVDGRAALRTLRERYTDSYPALRDLSAAIQTLETSILPQLVRNLIQQIGVREQTISQRIETAGADLSNIPVRTIEEARLRRQVGIQVTLYNELRQRVETTRLASASSIPDVSILDPAIPPQIPANDQRLAMTILAFFGLVGVGALGAVLLDRTDATVRDPIELERQLGIHILGAVPKIGDKREFSEDRVLEAFRELRMNLEFAYGQAGPLVFTVSSSTKGEGKSLVSANLAVVFSNMGLRTLLIDGDTRQGNVHELVGGVRKPGLTDLLMGHEMASIIQVSRFPRLDFIGSGSRKSTSPELLAGTRMRDLLGEARTRYDVIIIDSPPLTAGADAALLAAHTGHLALVVRSGTTQMELVAAKLEGLRRFPIRFLGAILNDFAETGKSSLYYYSNYLPGYEARSEGEDEMPLLPQKDQQAVSG